MTGKELKEKLKMEIRLRYHLIGVSCGAGITARNAVKGGADFILVLNSGRFRQMGLGSPAGLMPFYNCNELVLTFGTRELLPILSGFPVIFGLCATDPTIELESYIEMIKESGFVGINNYPSVGFFDQNFSIALEEAGITYDKEVEAIKTASQKDLFTIAFVFNPAQAKKMIDAGADAICVHLGLTKGGLLGAQKALSIKESVALLNDIFDICDELDDVPIKLVYGGPISSPVDVKYIYDNTSVDGYVGGSPFERTPVEEVVAKTTQDFKYISQSGKDEVIKILNGIENSYDVVAFIKEYISQNYMYEIRFSDLAKLYHMSRSNLSAKFKKETGYTFPEYLTNFRIHKACEIIAAKKVSLKHIPELTGFSDYPYFCKVFKKQIGMTPGEYSLTVE